MGNIISTSAGLMFKPVGGGSPYHADTQAAIAYLATQSVTLTTLQADILDRHVRDLHGEANPNYPTADIWAKIRVAYPFIGSTAAAHTLNLRNPAQPMAFVGAGLVHSGTGVKFDNVGYGNTGHNMAGLATGGIGYYSRTQKVTTLEFFAGAATGIGSADQILMGPFNDPVENIFCDLFGFASNLRIHIPTAQSIGYFSASRISNIDCRGYKNGAQSELNTVPNGGIASNVSVWLGMYNINDTPQGGTNTECAYAQLNNGLTPAEELNYYNSIQAYQTALDRQVTGLFDELDPETKAIVLFMVTLGLILTYSQIQALNALVLEAEGGAPPSAMLAAGEPLPPAIADFIAGLGSTE